MYPLFFCNNINNNNNNNNVSKNCLPQINPQTQIRIFAVCGFPVIPTRISRLLLTSEIGNVHISYTDVCWKMQ